MSYLTRNTYTVKVYIGGAAISDSLVKGSTMQITRTENDSAQLTFSIQPPTGSQTLNNYQGKSIIVDVQTSSSITRIFTGTIDIDTYDLVEECIKLQCTDDRGNRVRALENYIKTIGYFSEDVFGVAQDTTAELENRLSTIPYSFDFDAFGNAQLTPWLPKSSADFTLDSTQVYRKEPRIERTKRSQIVNSVTISLKYSYTRCHHRERNYTWSNGVSACDYLIYGYSLATREMIRQAAEAAGWPLKSSIGFTQIYPAGSYNCSGITIGFVTLSTNSATYSVKNKAVINGSSTTTIAKDAAGNPISGAATVTSNNVGDQLCIGASWTATTRFTQNIVEDYTLTVAAPQSIAQYGTITRKESQSLAAEFDSSGWENYKTYKAPVGDVTYIQDNLGNTLSDYYIDKDLTRSDFNAAAICLINRAKTTILKSHRENKALFTRFLWPELSLAHTVALDTNKIMCKGKVSKLVHTIEIGTGEAYTSVELNMYASTGSQTESDLSVPTRPSYVSTISGGSVALQSHYGQDPTTTAAQKWTGHIGNRYLPEYLDSNQIRTSYPEAFIVDTPDIDGDSRDTKTVTSTSTYNISIPNNSVTINYPGTY